MNDDDYSWARGINEDMLRRHQRIIKEMALLREAQEHTDRDYRRRIRRRKDWAFAALAACSGAILLLLIDGPLDAEAWLTPFALAMLLIGAAIDVVITIGMWQDRHYTRALNRWHKVWKEIGRP